MIKFATKATTVVAIDSDSSVTIRSKMNMKVKARVQDDIFYVSFGDSAAGTPSLRAAFSQKLALLKHNITSWEGPAFIGEDGKFVKFSPEALELLDPDESEEFIDLIVAKITELNQPKMAAEVVADESPLPVDPAI